jgi:hypothetical protein
MSISRKSDVKNHLSPRFHTKIHLCEPGSPEAAERDSAAGAPEANEPEVRGPEVREPGSQPDATGYSQPEPAAAYPLGNESSQSRLDLSSTSRRDLMAIVAPRKIQG